MIFLRINLASFNLEQECHDPAYIAALFQYDLFTAEKRDIWRPGKT